MESKKKFFWTILLLIPIVFLGITEVTLRIFHYGGNLDLVVRKTISGKEYYTLNRDVARRYFSQKGIAIPEAYDDVFEIKKQPTTKRIFMLGESTMAGYPYDYNATAPCLLRDRLSQLLPQYNIEVVNVGLAAVNSYTVLDFIKELVEYEPDAFVVYLGHNEFYGAMGVGSTEYLGQWRWLVKLYLQMRNVRLFLLVRDGIVALRSLMKPDVALHDVTLMEGMVREKTIRYNSKEYNVAKSNFEANLREIVSTAKSHRVPIILTTLASNVRDQKPLLATFSESTNDESKKKWNDLIERGNVAQQHGEFSRAFQVFEQAIKIDTLNADAYFYTAKCLDTLGRYDEAKRAYEKARDYDALRFRASSDFNELIRYLCQQENVPLADAERAFEQQSPHGLLGSNLMLEHLHPNFDGYFLLAKTFFQTIVDHNALVKTQEWEWDRNVSDDEYKDRSGVTEFDREVAKFRIFQLMSGWPFTHDNKGKREYLTQNKIQELAVAYAKKRLAWSQARYDLAEWYIQHKAYQQALREFFAVSKVQPFYYYPLMRMGDMYRVMDKSDVSEGMYKQAMSLQNSPYVHVRLGMLYFDEGKIADAIREFEETIEVEGKGSETMNARDRSSARYLLAVAYGKSGDVAKAKAALQAAVSIDPRNEEARKLLSQLP